MIVVRAKRNGPVLTFLSISGHAGQNDPGKDLVCAGVSAIAFGLLNALDQLDPTLELHLGKEADITIQVKQPNEASQIALEVGLIQLKTVEEQFPNFMTIVEV